MKNEIFEAEHLPNTSRSIWISFYISKLSWGTPQWRWNKYYGTRHSTFKKWQKWEKMMRKWSIQNSFRITPRRFLDLQDIKKHSKTMWNTLQNHSGAFRKNEEISAQTYHSDDFFDLKFSFSPCWRMCCPAGASRGKPGDSQKTYSRTSKMVGYFELSVTCHDRLLRGSAKWDFTSRMDSEHLQIDLNILLHI